MRQAARLERSYVGASRVAVEGAEAPEQQAHVVRLDRDPLTRTLALRHRPTALTDEPHDEGGDGFRQRRLDATIVDREVAVGRWHREDDDRGLLVIART